MAPLTYIDKQLQKRIIAFGGKKIQNKRLLLQLADKAYIQKLKYIIQIYNSLALPHCFGNHNKAKRNYIFIKIFTWQTRTCRW